MDRRFSVGLRNFFIMAGPDFSFALLFPQQYLAIEANVATRLDLAPLVWSLRAGPMVRVGHRDDSGRGVTWDFRLMAGANYVNLSGGQGLLLPSVGTEGEAIYWANAAYGFSARLRMDFVWTAPTVGVTVGVVF